MAKEYSPNTADSVKLPNNLPNGARMPHPSIGQYDRSSAVQGTTNDITDGLKSGVVKPPVTSGKVSTY